MSKNKTITDLQMDLDMVMKNIKNKILTCISKYSGDTGGLPPLPPYKVISLDTKAYYEYSDQCMRIGDEIVQLLLSTSLVLNHLNDVRSNGIARDTSNNYALLANFRKYVNECCLVLQKFKFDLMELKKQVNYRIRLLQDISFQK